MIRIAALALVAVFLTACGARGGLEPPPGAAPKKDEPIVFDKII